MSMITMGFFYEPLTTPVETPSPNAAFSRSIIRKSFSIERRAQVFSTLPRSRGFNVSINTTRIDVETKTVKFRKSVISKPKV